MFCWDPQLLFGCARGSDVGKVEVRCFESVRQLENLFRQRRATIKWLLVITPRRRCVFIPGNACNSYALETLARSGDLRNNT